LGTQRLLSYSGHGEIIIDIQKLTDGEVDERTAQLKDKFGDELFMPVHHYQRDEIVQFADYTGDSLELSRVSAGTSAKYIVFCGVYFMAEIARVLASPDKYVFIPDRSAGCPLADFASAGDVERLWSVLQDIHPEEYIPVTYANSHSGVKAFCGRNEGFVCTSSNVGKIFSWILEKDKRVFFMPDRNLGVNTALSMGMSEDYWVADTNPAESEANIRGKKLIIWNGFCIVHTVFTLRHVEYWRKKDPEIKIIVHPECEPDVAAASDDTGSTSKIKRLIEESAEGSKWVVGTEYNLVNRLKQNNPGKFIAPLYRSVCLNMSKITRRNLLTMLLSIEQGEFSKQVILDRQEANDARKAIEKMLEIG